MNKKGQEMEIMHKMCQRELAQLQINMERYLQESDSVQKILNRRSAAPAADMPTMGHRNGLSNMFALMAFDRYMSQLSTVIGMTRRFNIHLQLNSLPKTVIDTIEPFDSAALNCNGTQSHASQSRFVQDFVKWSNMWKGMEHEENTEVEFPTLQTLNGIADIQSERRAIESPENAKIQNNSPAMKKEAVEKMVPIKFADLDAYVRSILPLKDLSHIKEGYTFSAIITYVQNYNNLEFFVCEMADSQKLYEISSSTGLAPIDRSSPDVVFYVSHDEKDQTCEGRKCLWRAVRIPKELETNEGSVLLVDFGEIIKLTECELYSKSPKFYDIPPLAIKCVLKGLCDAEGVVNRDYEKCRLTLVANEYTMVNFRVLSVESRVLHVVILMEPKHNSEKVKSPETKHSPGKIYNPEHKMTSRSNPFLESFLLEEEAEAEDAYPLPLPISTIFGPTSKCDFNSNIRAKIGEPLLVTVTFVHSPIGFFANIEDATVDPYELFFWTDEDLTPTQKTMALPPKVNDIVLAQYSQDYHWYRAKVTEIMPEADLYKVFYIDFGNIEIVSLNSLAPCKGNMLDRPPQAVTFRLADLELNLPSTSNGSRESTDVKNLQRATQALNVIIHNQTINVDVVDRHGDELIVHLTDDQFTYIPAMLINMGIVRKFKTK